MKFKKFWKTYYYGFLAFAGGLGFLLFAKSLTFLLLFAFFCFLVGSILNLVLTFKQFKKDNDEIKIKLLKIQQILEEENESLDEKQIAVNSEVLDRLKQDASRYKFSLALNILIYLSISILSILFFINTCFIL